MKDINQGERFTDENVGVIRPGDGLHPREYFNVIGAVARADVGKGMPIVEAMV